MPKKLGLDQFVGLAAAVVARLPRDLDPDIAQRWTEGDGQVALHDALDLALRNGPPLPVDPNAWVDTFDLTQVKLRYFDLVIDPTQTIEQGVTAGEYNYVHPAHTTAVFGVHQKITGAKPVNVRVKAFCIGRNATREQAIRLRARLNLGATCIQHELALGAQHKNAQRDLNWIVNPDDVVLVDGNQYVSYLNGNPDDRRLYLSSAGGEWGGDTWFLGLASEPA